MHWIIRTHHGLTFSRRPDVEIARDMLNSFRHACEVFGFLVAVGERITPLDWCERIEQRYAPHHRRERVIAAIEACMTRDEGPHAELPLTGYAALGYRAEDSAPGASCPYPLGSDAAAAYDLGVHLQREGCPVPSAVGIGVDRAEIYADAGRFLMVGPGLRFVRID